MGLRRYVKANERETFLLVFIVMAGLAAYLGPRNTPSASTPTPMPLLTANDGGMEKLWLEAALGKGDIRPINDEVLFEEEAAPEALPAPSTPPPAEPEPAAEPARSFPEPLPVTEAYEEPERPRISAMRESLLESSRSGSSSSAFLAFPKNAQASGPAPAPATVRPAPPAPPRRRAMRPLSGN